MNNSKGTRMSTPARLPRTSARITRAPAELRIVTGIRAGLMSTKGETCKATNGDGGTSCDHD
jgi:hypothetical protein